MYIYRYTYINIHRYIHIHTYIDIYIYRFTCIYMWHTHSVIYNHYQYEVIISKSFHFEKFTFVFSLLYFI